MKHSIIFLGLLISHSMFGQFSEWKKEIIKSQRIIEVIIYMKVPETNTDRDKDGLIKIQKLNFNKEGLITYDTCYKCLDVEEGNNFDIISEYKYDNLDIVKEKFISSDSINYNYIYDKINKDIFSIIGKNNSGKVITIASIINKNSQIQKEIKLDFSYPYSDGDSICHVYIDIKEYNYSKDTVVTIINKRNSLCIYKETFDKIKKAYDNMYISEFLNDLTTKYIDIIDTSTFIYDSNKNLIKILKSNENFDVIFFYDKNGLLMTKKIGKSPIEFIYRYKRY